MAVPNADAAKSSGLSLSWCNEDSELQRQESITVQVSGSWLHRKQLESWRVLVAASTDDLRVIACARLSETYARRGFSRQGQLQGDTQLLERQRSVLSPRVWVVCLHFAPGAQKLWRGSMGSTLLRSVLSLQ